MDKLNRLQMQAQLYDELTSLKGFIGDTCIVLFTLFLALLCIIPITIEMLLVIIYPVYLKINQFLTRCGDCLDEQHGASTCQSECTR